MLKPAIDITSLIYRRGVSRYTANLVRSLAVHTDTHLRLLGYSLRQHSFLQEKAKTLIKAAPTNKQNYHQTKIQFWPPKIQTKLWHLGLNPISNIFPGINLIHSWDWIQPPDKNLPLVSTIHDLAILKYPETAHPRILKAHQRSWQVLKQRRAHIIAISQATKLDVIEHLEIPRWRVHVVPEALPQEIRQISQNMTENRHELIKYQLELTRPYLLFVGTQEPRKNLEKVIPAWLPLAQDYQLLIVGASGWDQISKHRPQHSNLRFLGRVSDQQLNVLYAEAEAFLYPSLYEGFGLPILEAFYHGTPVLTSDVSSMIEVAGNAAKLVDPESVDSIHQGLVELLQENELEQRKRLQRMIIRLQMFSWEKVAEQTVAVYQLAREQFEQ